MWLKKKQNDYKSHSFSHGCCQKSAGIVPLHLLVKCVTSHSWIRKKTPKNLMILWEKRLLESWEVFWEPYQSQDRICVPSQETRAWERRAQLHLTVPPTSSCHHRQSVRFLFLGFVEVFFYIYLVFVRKLQLNTQTLRRGTNKRSESAGKQVICSLKNMWNKHPNRKFERFQ